LEPEGYYPPFLQAPAAGNDEARLAIFIHLILPSSHISSGVDITGRMIAGFVGLLVV
jgi:hypothetical protein